MRSVTANNWFPLREGVEFVKNAPEKKEELIRQLRRIRDEETAKPYAEMDAQLVS